MKMSILEIQSSRVLRYYPLQEEQAQTEWWSGTIQLSEEEDGSLRAFYQGKEIK
jgi:hypothetical protein